MPLELVVSVGTGGKNWQSFVCYTDYPCIYHHFCAIVFREVKVPPRVGWDGVVAQILDSATDGEWSSRISLPNRIS